MLENDNVTVRGKSVDIFTYKFIMGGEISILAMLVEKIDINLEEKKEVLHKSVLPDYGRFSFL